MATRHSRKTPRRQLKSSLPLAVDTKGCTVWELSSNRLVKRPPSQSRLILERVI
jgi:hypothetical protein